jgi:hypothetical protein
VPSKSAAADIGQDQLGMRPPVLLEALFDPKIADRLKPPSVLAQHAAVRQRHGGEHITKGSLATVVREMRNDDVAGVVIEKWVERLHARVSNDPKQAARLCGPLDAQPLFVDHSPAADGSLIGAMF